MAKSRQFRIGSRKYKLTNRWRCSRNEVTGIAGTSTCTSHNLQKKHNMRYQDAGQFSAI